MSCWTYWAGEAITHTIVSFEFDDGARLAFSIETRKESHEGLFFDCRVLHRLYFKTPFSSECVIIADARNPVSSGEARTASDQRDQCIDLSGANGS